MSEDQTDAEKSATEIEHVGKLIVSARELREKLQLDPHRPMYHLMGPEDYNCAFDPHGLIFWKGRYHIFYPFFPGGINYWGHVSSTDLVHWHCHKTAIKINPGDPERHAFAGGAMVNLKGVPTLIYNGLEAGACVATSTDDKLENWTKSPANPVIAIPKEGSPEFGKYVMWDLCGWVDGKYHYCLSGGNTKEDGDVGWVFRSTDLVHWEFLHKFYKSDRSWTGPEEDCSCPDFFPIGKKHMLMFISHARGTQYYIGRYENEKFYPEQHGRMNWPGGACFAQESLVDDKGRRIMWAWVPDQRTRQRILRSGWAGIYSMPRVLSLAKDDSLLIDPPEELSMLRYDHCLHEKVKIAADSELMLKDVSGDCLELSLEVDMADAKEFGVKVCCSPDGQEQTVIVVDPAAGVLRIDTTRSTLSKEVVQPFPHNFMAFYADNPLIEGRQDVRVQVAPFVLKKDEPLKLRIFLDRSILEVFANSRQCVTQRVYPDRADSLGVALFSRGGAVTIHRLDAWKMNASNPW